MKTIMDTDITLLRYPEVRRTSLFATLTRYFWMTIPQLSGSKSCHYCRIHSQQPVASRCRELQKMWSFYYIFSKK